MVFFDIMNWKNCVSLQLIILLKNTKAAAAAESTPNKNTARKKETNTDEHPKDANVFCSKLFVGRLWISKLLWIINMKLLLWSWCIVVVWYGYWYHGISY